MLHYAQPGLGPPPGSNKGMVGKGPPTVIVKGGPPPPGAVIAKGSPYPGPAPPPMHVPAGPLQGGGKPMVVKGALPPGVVMKGHPDPAGYHQHPGPPAPGPALKGKPGGKVIIKGGPPPPGVVIGGPPPGRGPMLIGAPPGQQLQQGAPGSLVGPPAPGQGAGGAPAPPNGPQTLDPHAQPAARSDKGGVAGVPVMPQAQHHHQQHDQHGHKGPPGGGHSAHYNDHNKGHRDDPSTDRGGKMKGGGSKYNHQDPYNPQLHAGKGSGPPPPGGHGQAQPQVGAHQQQQQQQQQHLPGGGGVSSSSSGTGPGAPLHLQQNLHHQHGHPSGEGVAAVPTQRVSPTAAGAASQRNHLGAGGQGGQFGGKVTGGSDHAGGPYGGAGVVSGAGPGGGGKGGKTMMGGKIVVNGPPPPGALLVGGGQPVGTIAANKGQMGAAGGSNQKGGLVHQNVGGAPPYAGVAGAPENIPPGHILEIRRNPDGSETHIIRAGPEGGHPPGGAIMAQPLPSGAIVQHGGPPSSSAGGTMTTRSGGPPMIVQQQPLGHHAPGGPAAPPPTAFLVQGPGGAPAAHQQPPPRQGGLAAYHPQHPSTTTSILAGPPSTSGVTHHTQLVQAPALQPMHQLPSGPPSTRGPPPREFLTPEEQADPRGGGGASGNGSVGGGGEITRKDFATRKPDVYDYFRTKNVLQSKEAPGLWDIHLYSGMCRDKHVHDFMECLEAWCVRLLGEKPYHIHRFNLSGNDLSDSSVKIIMTTLIDLQIRVDHLDLSKNKTASLGAQKIADYLWSSDPLQSLLLDQNHLSMEDVNVVLRAVYNHTAYPIRRGSGCPVPLRFGITQNPVTMATADHKEGRIGELLNTIRKQGGKDRVWFSNSEHALTPDELEKHKHRLENCYLAVHMPKAFTGSDDTHRTKRRRKRKRAESSSLEQSSDAGDISYQSPAARRQQHAGGGHKK